MNITVGWTPTHYGPSTEDEANEFQRQLEASGLFKVTLKSTEWEQYQTIYKQGAYDLWILGWFPDYPDADDYLSPFLVDGGFFQNGYKNPQANKLVAQEQGTDDQAKRQQIFGQLQDIAAKDVPFIPSLGRPEHRGVRQGHEGCRGAPSTRRSSSGSGWSPRTAERPHSTRSWGGTRAVSPHEPCQEATDQ